MLFHIICQVLLFPVPWLFRRVLLNYFYGYAIDQSAHIGYSIISVKSLKMAEHSKVGNLTLIKGLTDVSLAAGAVIGNLNWITAFPENDRSMFFGFNRRPSLSMGIHSVITHRHLIDCTDLVQIAEFGALAGWRSQILTHGVDVQRCRQKAAGVYIGRYSMVGSGSIILCGSIIPDKSLVLAGSVITKKFIKDNYLYAGTPAREVGRLRGRVRLFEREHSVIR